MQNRDSINTRFRIVCESGDLEVVRTLVEQGIDTSTANMGFGIAADNGRLNVVQYLFEQHVDVADDNNYALKGACANGHLEVVKFLVNKPGVDVASDFHEAIRDAAFYNHPQVVQFLITQYQSFDEVAAGIIETLENLSLPAAENLKKALAIRDTKNTYSLFCFARTRDEHKTEGYSDVAKVVIEKTAHLAFGNCKK